MSCDAVSLLSKSPSMEIRCVCVCVCCKIDLNDQIYQIISNQMYQMKYNHMKRSVRDSKLNSRGKCKARRESKLKLGQRAVRKGSEKRNLKWSSLWRR